MLKVAAYGMGFYPIVAHLGLWFFSPRIAVFYLLSLLLITLLYPPRFYQLKNIFLASSLLVSIILLALNDLDHWLIYLPPVLIPSLLLTLFLQSLSHNKEPLITKFARAIETEKLSNERIHYTRHVTQLWAAVFFFMIIESIALTLLAPIEIWSLVTHVGNYILIATVVSAEFIYRRYKFKSESDQFVNFILKLTKHRWK